MTRRRGTLRQELNARKRHEIPSPANVSQKALRAEGLSPIVQTPWQTEQTKLAAHASFGMPATMKEALREAARRLTLLEGHKVSMSEVLRRLAAAGGLR